MTRDGVLILLMGIKWPSVYETQHPLVPDELKNEGWSWALDDTNFILVNKMDNMITKQEVREFCSINQRITAPEFLDVGAKHMRDRAAQRDSETGERSMKACVDAFNALYGTQLTETQGWQFMVLLKMSRARTGVFSRDDYEDQAAYAALAGESAQ